jgi:hypothetical protein
VKNGDFTKFFKKNLFVKITRKRDLMFKVNKYLFIGMLVMMICCVTAVSATDVNGTDDTVITDELVVDEVSEVVEDVEIDDASDSVVEEQNLRQPETGTVNGVNYSNYFDTSSGYTTTTNDLTFSLFNWDYYEI